ncbi:PRTRC genetic system protein F [Paraburkholderia sp. RAU2J]|uniref:PRTRC system protein F n=1 Tax=Paraburkholderia sp. RAU2J TaxID=1938810 RepID=UPI000EAE8620|nr:PRTRC system protein F [Paraburkholderia sp. RAU2J]RKT10616.1 PRTRC genetic system protein F [Paraburkholderia sp. RAU2J]
MLFDSRTYGDGFAENAPASRESCRNSIARRKPSADFLTLPKVGSSVPSMGQVSFQTERALCDLVAMQFSAGVLEARDVQSYGSAPQAMAQAFTGWLRRQQRQWRALNFQFLLYGSEAVAEIVEYQEHRDDFEPDAPLYLTVEFPDDYVYSIGAHAEELRMADPRLLPTALRLIAKASGRTLNVRLPHEFLEDFACWYWDGDATVTDTDVVKELRRSYGRKKTDYQRYLPSVASDQLCPVDMDIYSIRQKERRFRPQPKLSIAALRRLHRTTAGRASRLAQELAELSRLLCDRDTKPAFDFAFMPECVYAACTLIAHDNDYIGQLLDDRYNFAAQGSGTTYFGFIPFATEPEGIRKQYARWTKGIRLLSQLDRVLALLIKP